MTSIPISPTQSERHDIAQKVLGIANLLVTVNSLTAVILKDIVNETIPANQTKEDKAISIALLKTTRSIADATEHLACIRTLLRGSITQ